MAHLLMVESFLEGNAKILPNLLKKLGHSYTFVTRNKNIYPKDEELNDHNVIKCADSIIETDTNSIKEILNAIRNQKFDGIITTCDYYIETVQKLSEQLNIPCPFPRKVDNVRYKHNLRKILDEAKLWNPKYEIACNWNEVLDASRKIGFPLVLKPVDLSSSAYVRLIRNAEELRDAFDLLESFPINWRDQKRNCIYLLEEYMVGDEISVEAITFQGNTEIIGITEKSLTGEPYFIENGHMFPADLTEKRKKEISEYVVKALHAAEYDHGISHTEVKLTKDGPRIIEINPRVAGDYIAELINLVCGVEILRAFIDLSLGEKPIFSLKKTDKVSASIMFLTPKQGGRIFKIEGKDVLKTNPNVVFYQIADCDGMWMETPVDNVGRLGRIIVKDVQGYNAMKFARELMSQLEVKFE